MSPLAFFALLVAAGIVSALMILSHEAVNAARRRLARYSQDEVDVVSVTICIIGFLGMIGTFHVVFGGL